MSNILLVTRKPPQILMVEMKVAAVPKAWGIVCGRTPPPINRRPPTAVMPEMALVTDIRGECKAGVTPHTV